MADNTLEQRMQHVVDEVRANWGWLMVMGAALTVLGVVGLYMSGVLTVLVQPRLRLWPRKGKGDPGKFAPVKCQPSSLSTLNSYQATPPRRWPLQA